MLWEYKQENQRQFGGLFQGNSWRSTYEKKKTKKINKNLLSSLLYSITLSRFTRNRLFINAFEKRFIHFDERV